MNQLQRNLELALRSAHLLKKNPTSKNPTYFVLIQRNKYALGKFDDDL